MTTPVVSSYDKALEKGAERKFEVVLVNYDKDAAKHAAYMAKSKMKFPSVKRAESEKSPFAKVTKVKYLPTLIAVKPDGTLITDDRAKVLAMIKKDAG